VPTVVVVSKKQPISKIKDLYSVGHRDFGENYAVELAEKANMLKEECPEIRWHFIGQIQSNKIKVILEYCSVFHSIHNSKHLKKISELAKSEVHYFININLNQEPQKNGLGFEETKGFYEAHCDLPNTRCLGLMSIPAAILTKNEQTSSYQELVAKAQQIGEGEVSLGMSGDYKAALKAGSSYLRLGSLIMGERT